MRFKDHGVLVTGAASGIGRETAHAFTAEGARVALADIDLKAAERSAGEIREKGGSAQVFPLEPWDGSLAACFAVPISVDTADMSQAKAAMGGRSLKRD